MSVVKGTKAAAPTVSAELLKQLTEALSQMRFGQLTLIVHDGKVVQIEKTEKTRLNETSPGYRCSP